MSAHIRFETGALCKTFGGLPFSPAQADTPLQSGEDSDSPSAVEGTSSSLPALSSALHVAPAP